MPETDTSPPSTTPGQAYALSIRLLAILVTVNSALAFLFGLLAGPYYAGVFPESTAFELALGSQLLLWNFIEKATVKTGWLPPFLVIGLGYFVVNLFFPNAKPFLWGAAISPIRPELLGLMASSEFQPWGFVPYLGIPVALFASRLRIARRVYLGPARRLLQWGVISKFCFYFVAYLVWVAYQAKPGLWGSAYLIFLGIPYSALAEGSRRIEHRVVQRARDLLAASILFETLREPAGRRARYCLYLRPFSLTGLLPLKNVKKTTMPLLISTYSQESKVDLETMLAESMRGSARLVALGSPGEMYGAGRIHSSEEEWFDNFRNLAEGAETIFIMPSPSPGTLKEIQWLYSRALLRKCIFMMPVTTGKSAFEEKWTSARDQLAPLGPHLPQYERAGLMFVMNSQGEVIGKESFPLTRPGEWRKTFARLRTISEKQELARTQGNC